LARRVSTTLDFKNREAAACGIVWCKGVAARPVTGKRPIDRMRDAGGSFTIGDVDDGTPIKEFVVMGAALHAITLRGVYEVRLADQIDPDRTNPALPHNVHRRVLAVGLDSDLVCRVLLTAKTLFDPKFLRSGIDHERALLLAFAALENLVAMSSVAADFAAAEQRAIAAFEARTKAGRSMMLPAVGDVRTRCTTFIQKADHAAVALRDIARLFYPVAKSWTDVRDTIIAEFGSDDPVSREVGRALPFMLLVRNARDCLEHKLKGVVIDDFALTAGASIERPSIAIDFRTTRQPQIALALFFDQVAESMTNAVELIIAMLCSKNTQSSAGFPIQVVELDDHWRAGRHVRFSYGTYMNGKVVPIG
jgi:hypothetical protein